MLVLTRKAGEKINIGDNITVTICSIRGSNVVVGIDALKEIKILRVELAPNYVSPKSLDEENPDRKDNS